MKKQRNIPVLHEVMQHQNQYQTHLAKLQRIQAQRRHSLARKSFYQKTVMIEHIKNQKHTDFMQRLERDALRINQQNVRFVDKLTRAAVSVSSRSRRSTISQTSLTSVVKRDREKQINRQNKRIFQKLNSSCPYVNTQKINDQYGKMKKISDRLRKYDNSCELKTKKYMRKTMNGTLTSNFRFSPTRKQNRQKPGIAQFYNRQDIIRNQINRRGAPSIKLLLGTIENRKPSQQKYYDFFNTQVNPQQQSTL